MEFDETSSQVIGAAMAVHKELGPGLFEEVYKACLRHELQNRGLKVLHEVGMPVTYDGVELVVGYRIDLLVEDSLIIELKSVHQLVPIHKAQLLTYLRLADLPVGLLLNFNTQKIKDGIVRVVNSYTPSRSSRPSRYNFLNE
jgi:GxxExxY protein